MERTRICRNTGQPFSFPRAFTFPGGSGAAFSLLVPKQQLRNVNLGLLTERKGERSWIPNWTH